MYIIRDLESVLLRRAKSYPILSIIGPRQSGKSTLAQYTFANHQYVNLENSEMKLYAQNDPRGFLAEYSSRHGVIIDEFQVVPELLSDIMTVVDRDKKMAQFVLTGSQNFLLNRTVQQSLAGRVSLNTLLPLSISELKKADMLPESLDEILYRGFYPFVHRHKDEPEHWYANYEKTYVEQDIKSIRNIDTAKFKKFVRLCATRVGQTVNYTRLAADCTISDQTVRDWIDLLEKTYIVYTIGSYTDTSRKRITKSPKLYFYDTGLACFLRGLERDDVETFSDRGHFFESFAITEMMKGFYHRGNEPAITFWRDTSGTYEVDAIVKLRSNNFPVEIKTSNQIGPSLFRGIDKWNVSTSGDPDRSFLVYGGETHQTWRKGHVVPWRDIDTIIDTAAVKVKKMKRDMGRIVEL